MAKVTQAHQRGRERCNPRAQLGGSKAERQLQFTWQYDVLVNLFLVPGLDEWRNSSKG